MFLCISDGIDSKGDSGGGAENNVQATDTPSYSQLTLNTRTHILTNSRLGIPLSPR